MRRNLYRAVAGSVRRFFVATGIPVPRFARRASRALAAAFNDDLRDLRKEVKALRKEVEALRLRVDRVETTAYLDSIGRRPD
jgi:hypothetical protein